MKTKEKLFDELIEALKKTGKDFSYQFVVRHADKSSYTREDYEWLLPLMYEENKKSNPNCTFEEYLQGWINDLKQKNEKKISIS